MTGGDLYKPAREEAIQVDRDVTLQKQSIKSRYKFPLKQIAGKILAAFGSCLGPTCANMDLLKKFRESNPPIVYIPALSVTGIFSIVFQ
jgi:hypothetical protein